MSNKGKGISDQSVKERRLRPVYEFLDLGHHKRVVQETDRLLKKQPDFQCAKAIKALALLRMGHVAECRAIVDTIVGELPTDDNTIQALTICYRELGQPKMVCTILENASKIEQTEDLLSSCFMANVRVSDFQKQYQVALNLYKVNPKPPYFAWAVMSLFAKAELDPDPSSVRISLPLAEKMMGKYVDDNSVNSEHELSLYILILMKMGNYKKILEMLDQFAAHRTPALTGFYYRIKSECLRMTQHTTTLSSYIETSILKDLEEWKYFEDYIKNFGLSETTRTKEFFDDLLAKNLSSPSRSELIAPLFLYTHLIRNNKEPDFDSIPYLRNYLMHYGNSYSFFTDLEMYFSCITAREMRLEIAQTIRMELEHKLDFSKPNEIQAQLNYCYAQRYLESSDESDGETILNTVEMYVNKYLLARGKQLTDGVKWPLKEGPHDYFINLVSLTLADRFWPVSSDWSWSYANKKSEANEAQIHSSANQISHSLLPTASKNLNSAEEVTSGEQNGTEIAALTNGTSFLQLENQNPFQPNRRDIAPLLTLSLLHYCLDKSPRNSQTRLLLAKSYIRCGAVGAGAYVLVDLDIKHFMLLSTTYLCTWKLISCAQHEDGLRYLSTLESFYSSFEKEGMEHVLSAYKYGSWEKILEFLKFRDHILSSMQRQLMAVEKSLLEYCMEEPATSLSDIGVRSSLIKISRRLDVDVTENYLSNINQMTDCRDMDIVDTFRIRPNIQEWKEVSFHADKKKLKVRAIILGLLNNSILLAEEWSLSENISERLLKIETLLGLLNDELTSVTAMFILSDVTIDAMWPPRISQYVKGGCLSLLFDLFKITYETVKDQSKIEFKEIIAKLKTCVENVIGEEKLRKFEDEVCLLDIAGILENITELTETLSLSCILIDVISLILKRAPGNHNKSRKRRPKPAVNGNSNHVQMVELIQSTKEAFKNIDSFLRTFNGVLSNNYPNSWDRLAPFWQGQVNNGLLEDILPFSMPVVVAKLRSSYINSTTALSYLILSKLKYLEGILQTA